MALPVVAACTMDAPAPPTGVTQWPLGEGTFEEVDDFGDDPGNLRMFRYVPSPPPDGAAPLVVALHGCDQTAEDYRNVGWEALADAAGFYVLYPQQRESNNPLRCFNWAGELGGEANLRRGEGENRSIVSMIDAMKDGYDIDPQRVFVTGLSAGGAQTAVMLATWPDVFAAGGIVAGIPYRCATTLEQAQQCMDPGRDRTPAQWGDAVREAHPDYEGDYPKVSLWHGTADRVVAPANLTELLEQWTDVHGIDAEADARDDVDGHPRARYHDAAGAAQVETYELTDRGHGAFIDPDRGCGNASRYVQDADICSAARMAEFFDLDVERERASADAGPGDDGAMSGTGGCRIARRPVRGAADLALTLLGLLLWRLRSGHRASARRQRGNASATP